MSYSPEGQSFRTAFTVTSICVMHAWCQAPGRTALLSLSADPALRHGTVSQLLTLQPASGFVEREWGCTSFILQLVKAGKLSSTVKITQDILGKFHSIPDF